MGIIILLSYVSVSYILISGTKEVSLIYFYHGDIKHLKSFQRRQHKIQWFSIFILVAFVATVFLIILSISSSGKGKIEAIIVFTILSILNAYAFLVINSLQSKFRDEEDI